MELRTGVPERRLIGQRVLIAAFCGVCLLMLLLTRLIWLQLIEHERFVTASEANRLQTIPIGPARGLILDRNGLVLAENTPRLRVSVVPEESDDLEAFIDAVRERITLTDAEFSGFQKNLKSRRRPRDPVILKEIIGDEEAAILAVDAYQFPELRLEARPTRSYPFGRLTSHSLGYVGRLSSGELQNIDQRRYSGTEMIGKIGVEKAYENALLGQVGIERVETSARGQIMRSIERQEPVPGDNIKLHLDIGLQAKLYDILGDRRGAVVALDPRNGGIMALVSAPSFDANIFTHGLSNADYRRLEKDSSNPLFNRALRGQYPPGSTLKPMLGMVGLHYGSVNWKTEIRDRGYFQIEGIEHKYRDWKKWGHGRVNLEKAIIESCDTYFYEAAVRLGIDQMAEGMGLFGFGRRMGQDIVGELPGILPSREWKRSARKEAWYLGETVIAGIGQGSWVTTPLQLATATMVMARRGNFIAPHYSTRLDDDSGRRVNLASTLDWERMIDAMENVFHGERGTARGSAKNLKYRIAGKTGTVQVVGIAQEEEYEESELKKRFRDHALFIGFAPADSPSLVIALILENGGSGGSTAAPIARKIFDYWLLDRNEGERPPDIPYVLGVNDELARRPNAGGI